MSHVAGYSVRCGFFLTDAAFGFFKLFDRIDSNESWPKIPESLFLRARVSGLPVCPNMLPLCTAGASQVLAQFLIDMECNTTAVWQAPELVSGFSVWKQASPEPRKVVPVVPVTEHPLGQSEGLT